ncbi:MAG: GAF domain-containing protein [Adhaeribacter sp.]
MRNSSSIRVPIEKNFDSEFCGSLPLHLVNLIQPHGLLLVLEKKEYRIIQLSQNAQAWFNLPAEDLLDQPLSDFISHESFADIQAKAGNQSHQVQVPFSFTFTANGRSLPVSALVHPKEEHLLIEMEQQPSGLPPNSFIALYQQVKYLTSLMKQAPDKESLAQLMAREFRTLSGFDRVLVYQFDPSWNGIVIGQDKVADMEDYLHLRFPASDVPRQARELYFRNPFRLIPNRDYEPVGMVPVINPHTQRFTDLADCSLRSVAKVHLEYMANMQIKASMSLPIIIGEQLWGLISCHHKSPSNPSYEMRSALELLAGIFSAQLEARERETAMGLQVQLKAVFAQLLDHLYSQQNLAEGLLTGTMLLDLFGLSGAALLYDGEVYTSGTTPGTQEMKELAFWLRRQEIGQVYATDSLPRHYARSQDYKEVASGLLAVAIHPEQGEYLLGFRSEVEQTIAWGGNPHQAIQVAADGKTYHPRNSFAVYRETVKHTSLPWEAAELEVAATLRSTVLEKIIKNNY